MSTTKRHLETNPTAESGWEERREDYALRYVPNGYRQWGFASLTGVMLGVATAMFFLAWGGSLVTAYGTRNLFLGMVFGTLFVGGLAFLLARISSATGLDSDLITRGSGFGFMGSAITSLIYSFNFLMFFAFEGTIMSSAIHARFPSVPEWLLYLVIGLVFIPLTWWGLTVMNWVMWVTLPIYLGFLGWTVYLAATNGAHVHFWGYTPSEPTNPEAGPALLQVGAAVLGLITQATIAADVGRFIPAEKRTAGAFAVGFLSQLLTFLGATMLGGWLTLRLGGNTNPGNYLASLIGTWGVLFVIVTQLRINVTNVYSGSLAYANFFCRVFHFTPGRQYWVVLTAFLGTALMFGGIFAHLNAVLTFEGVFVMAWILAIVSDITINKRLLKLSPQHFMYKRSHTYRYNPVGMGALAVALVVAVPLAFGVAGDLGKTLAPYISGALAFVTAPVLALLTKGRYYEPRTVAVNIDPELPPRGAGAEAEVDVAAHEKSTQECVKCHHDFELAEYVSCPFLDAPICSVCCAAEPRCGELCKSDEVIASADDVRFTRAEVFEERSWRAQAAAHRSS